jgi:hypothetical protein
VTALLRLAHKPTISRSMPTQPAAFDQQRSEPLHPPVHAHVVYGDAPFRQQLLHVAVGQPVAEVPTYRQDDHIRWEAETGESRPRCGLSGRATTLWVPNWSSTAVTCDIAGSGSLTLFRVRNRGRCAGRCGGGKMGAAFVRDADLSVMLSSSWSQDGVGDYRQELSIVAVSTRTRLFWPCGPSGRARVSLSVFLGEDSWSCCMNGALGWISGRGISRRCGCRKPRPCAVSCIVSSPTEGHRTGHARIIRRAPATVLPRPHRHGHAPAVTANEQRR